jgi:hypothetical protein
VEAGGDIIRALRKIKLDFVWFRQKWSVASTFLGVPDCSVHINHRLATERRGGRGGGGAPMPVRPIDRGQRPWNKGLLIGQKKPLEPKHVWSIRVRLEIARSRRDLVIFNLAIDSKLRACDLDQSSSRSRSSRGPPLKPGYHCSEPLVPDISFQVDFMQVLTYQSANMPGWFIAGLKASA